MVFLQALGGLLFVLALIGIATLLLRWLKQNERFKGFLSFSNRLAIKDRLVLDSKRTVVILQYDQEEVCILLGLSGETILHISPMKDIS